MKRNNKEISIFNMSALDLFASALGAFIILAVIFMPFFPNTFATPAEVSARIKSLTTNNVKLSEDVTQLTAKANQCTANLTAHTSRADQCESQLNSINQNAQQSQNAANQCQTELEAMSRASQQCQQELDKTFLLVIISWKTKDDIDLHIVDPAGREYSYKNRIFPGSEAKFEEDNTKGPGNEVWLHPNVEPGEYRVYYKYFDQNDTSAPQIRGSAIYQKGRKELPITRITTEGDKKLVAILTVGADGNVTLR